MKKNTILPVIAVVCATLTLLAIPACSGSGAFTVETAVKGPFYIKVRANGQLQSAASIHIGCPPVQYIWNYTISSMAPEGKEVKEGDEILSFDTKELMERMQVRQSELDTAKKELERLRLAEQEAKDNLDLKLAEAKVMTQKARQKAEQPEEFVKLNELKKMRMDLELAILQEKVALNRVKNQESGMKTRIREQVAKVKRLEKQVVSYRDGIAMMKVKAPKPGIVVYTPDWDGNKKVVGDRCWRGSTIMELPDLSRMQVKAVIPEPQAGKVKKGLETEIRLDSSPERAFTGKIKSLGRIFRTKSNEQPAIVFDAIIDIEDPDPETMRPGMAASVDVIVSSRENVLQVPEDAIVYHQKGMFVRKKTMTGFKMTPVTIGVRSAGVVEILGGLDENDQVLISGSAASGNGEG